ncbi:uncharacterized protein YALI1_E00928g [Yarrowia lipolytica]|uniref:Large ribosomal subunit protein eL14 domain-containing protein n=1 Tax=Yarrowia lipolytica TaxID=4952 RepID=A0A1D8NGK7_YARLL|nr:hypothetical protein YALI1_E00928g [Yarrowia lipolytica]
MARQKFTDNERGVRRERAYQFGHLLVETRHVSTEWLLNRKLYHHEIFFQKELTLRLLFAGVLKAVVLIDGPTTGVARQVANLKHVTLTPHVVEGVKRGMKSKTIKAKVEASPAFKEWSESSWAKKIAQRERRRHLTDFERFQVMVHRRERKAALAKAVAKA